MLYMLDALREGVFYILVLDGETRKEVDQSRILWAAVDVAEGRPAFSRIIRWVECFCFFDYLI